MCLTRGVDADAPRLTPQASLDMFGGDSSVGRVKTSTSLLFSLSRRSLSLRLISTDPSHSLYLLLIICGTMSTSIRFLCLLSVLLPVFVQAGSLGHEHLYGLRHRSLHRRALGISPNLPANWSSKGCYSDNVNSRALNGKTYVDGAMTQESCISFCSNNGYAYAGVEVRCFQDFPCTRIACRCLKLCANRQAVHSRMLLLKCHWWLWEALSSDRLQHGMRRRRHRGMWRAKPAECVPRRCCNNTGSGSWSDDQCRSCKLGLHGLLH